METTMLYYIVWPLGLRVRGRLMCVHRGCSKGSGGLTLQVFSFDYWGLVGHKGMSEKMESTALSREYSSALFLGNLETTALSAAKFITRRERGKES